MAVDAHYHSSMLWENPECFFQELLNKKLENLEPSSREELIKIVTSIASRMDIDITYFNCVTDDKAIDREASIVANTSFNDVDLMNLRDTLLKDVAFTDAALKLNQQFVAVADKLSGIHREAVAAGQQAYQLAVNDSSLAEAIDEFITGFLFNYDYIPHDGVASRSIVESLLSNLDEPLELYLYKLSNTEQLEENIFYYLSQYFKIAPGTQSSFCYQFHHIFSAVLVSLFIMFILSRGTLSPFVLFIGVVFSYALLFYFIVRLNRLKKAPLRRLAKMLVKVLLVMKQFQKNLAFVESDQQIS